MTSTSILGPVEQIAADAFEAAQKWGYRKNGPESSYGPGAMEGNPWWTAYFQELAMDGCTEDDPIGNWEVFILSPNEKKAFSLFGKDYVLIGQDTNGFIHVRAVTWHELNEMREKENGNAVPF